MFVHAEFIFDPPCIAPLMEKLVFLYVWIVCGFSFKEHSVREHLAAPEAEVLKHLNSRSVATSHYFGPWF